MFRRRPAHTVLVAAAGLGGLAATAHGDSPPADPPSTPPVSPAVADTAALPADAAPARGLAARIATLPAAAVARLARRTDPEALVPERRHRRKVWTILHVRRNHRVSLRVRPRGHVFERIGGRTQFGSRQTLTVAQRRGRWLGVITSERPNGRLAWVDGRSSAVERHHTRMSVRIDLSQRRLKLRAGHRTLRSATVGTGAAASPTPPGRFSITDKLSGARFRGVYGCCVLALSGRQENLPAGWRGGNRLAIHGTPGDGAAGGSSAGCVRADARTLRLLMRQVPLGTPVFIVR